MDVDLIRQLAHEIEAPLTSLELQLRKLLAESPQNPIVESCLEEIASLKHLVTGLVELRGRVDGRSELPLPPLLQRVGRRFGPIAAARNVDLRWSCTVTSAIGDAMATERILANLVDNAIKFSRDAGHVRISTRRIHRSVEVEVTDDGIGIAKDALDAVFAPFYRADRETAGSGLGLAIAKHLAEAQRATLRCESEPGRGSTFILTLLAT